MLMADCGFETQDDLAPFLKGKFNLKKMNLWKLDTLPSFALMLSKPLS